MMISNIDRFAAYASARSALGAIQRINGWPRELSDEAQKSANNIITNTAQAIDHEPTSAERRRCLRIAICHALELAAICDIASKHGLTSAALTETLRHTSRTISMLGLSFHATAAADD